MSAYLATGKGQVVKVPHFIRACGNCGAPAAFWLDDAETRGSARLRFECAGCRTKGSVDVDMTRKREAR